MHIQNKNKFRGLIIFTILMFSTISIISAGTIKKSEIKETLDLYDLLIITPGEFEKNLIPLKNHKEKYDVKTKIVTLSEIYDVMYWEGRDNPEKIKYYIKNAYDNWGIKYVLLVGNYLKMPIRYVENQDINKGFYEPRFISELYYADLYYPNGSFSSWDTNNNGIFGEWIGDSAEDKNIDLIPEVYVGRLACKKSFEVKIMVDKIIHYETKTYEKSWFNKIIAVAGDTYKTSDNPNWTAIEGEESARLVISYMPGFENITLFTSDDTFTGPTDIIKNVNRGCGFLYFEGHASPRSWGTNNPNTGEFIKGLSVSNMPYLFNGYKLPVCIVGGCHNNQFDCGPKRMIEDIKNDGILNYFKLNPLGRFYYNEWTPECWGWKLTRKIGGGSIATMGCSGLGMSKEDKESFSGAGDYLQPQVFYEYGMNGTDILGECWGKSIIRYLDEYPVDWDTPAAWDYAIDAKTVQQWVLFGDPSLKIGGYE